MPSAHNDLSRLVKDLRVLVDDTARFLERLDAYTHREIPEPTDAAKLIRLEEMQRQHAAELAQITAVLSELNERHGRG